MNVESVLSENGLTLTISIWGEFNFMVLNEFRAAYNNDTARSAKNIIIDLRKTETIDSSALGMLLNMQRSLKKSNREIRIINCNEVVKRIFAITHFDKKFVIE